MRVVPEAPREIKAWNFLVIWIRSPALYPLSYWGKMLLPLETTVSNVSEISIVLIKV